MTTSTTLEQLKSSLAELTKVGDEKLHIQHEMDDEPTYIVKDNREADLITLEPGNYALARVIVETHDLLPLLLEAVSALKTSQQYLEKLSDEHGDKGASSAWAGNELLFSKLNGTNLKPKSKP